MLNVNSVPLLALWAGEAASWLFLLVRPGAVDGQPGYSNR